MKLKTKFLVLFMAASLTIAGFGFLANALSLENTFAVAIPAVHITVIG